MKAINKTSIIKSLSLNRFLFLITALGLFTGVSIQSYAQTANLGKLLHQVEANAPALKAAHSNTKIYEANRREGLGKLFGTIDAFGQLQFFNDNRLTRPISPPINFATLPYDKSQIGRGLSFTLPIDVNGQIITHLNALVHQEHAARYDEDQVRLTLLNQASTLFHGIESVSGKIEAQGHKTGHAKFVAYAPHHPCMPGTGKTVAGNDGAHRWTVGLVQGSGKGFPHMIVELDLLFHHLSTGEGCGLSDTNKIHAMIVKAKRPRDTDMLHPADNRCNGSIGCLSERNRLFT